MLYVTLHLSPSFKRNPTKYFNNSGRNVPSDNFCSRFYLVLSYYIAFFYKSICKHKTAITKKVYNN